jgi:hypothetical protein
VKLLLASESFKPMTEILRRAIIGPLLLGLVFGGIPASVALVSLGRNIFSAELLRYVLLLSPLVLIVVILGALTARRNKLRDLFRGALLASLAACVPLPISVCFGLALWWGYDSFSQKNILTLFEIFTLWAAMLTLSAWSLAALSLGLKRSIFRMRSV